MASDLAGQRLGLAAPTRPAGKHIRDTPVQEPASGEAGLFVDQGAQLFVAEVIAERALVQAPARVCDQPLSDQLFQAVDRLFLAAPARLPQGVKVE